MAKYMTSHELTELLDEFRFPFGDQRADLRAALQSVHASFRKPGAPTPDLFEIALKFKGERDTTNPEAEIVKLLNAIPGAHLVEVDG